MLAVPTDVVTIFGAAIMTFAWTVKNANGEVLSHFTSALALEVACKLVPDHYDAFRLQVSSSYREFFERALKQVLEHKNWRIVRQRRKSVGRSGRQPRSTDQLKAAHELTNTAGLEHSIKTG